MPVFMMYWRRTLRKPGSIVAWMLLPFVFMTIYQLVFGGDGGLPSTGLAIIDQDQSLVSGLVAGAFNQGPAADMVEVHTAADLAELEKLFEKETVSGGLVIPEGFGDKLLSQEPVTLTLYRNPRHFVGPQIIEGFTETLATLGNGLMSVSEGMIGGLIDGDQTPLAGGVGAIAESFFTAGDNTPNLAGIFNSSVDIVEDKTGETQGLNYVALFFPGLIMFGLLSVSLSLETRFLYDRLNKVNHRLVMSPLQPMQLLLQQRVYAMTFLYAVGVVTAVLGAIIWRVPPKGLLLATVIQLAMVAFIAGINGAIFSLSNSKRATSAISSFVMMFLMLFGGGFFPAEALPSALQSISRLTPTGMANIGLTQSLTGRDVTISIPVLLVYCGAFVVLSVVLGRRRVVSS